MAGKKFDAYHKLLGIPPKEQPPHHYRLLGIELFESDRDVIISAADQRMLALEQMTTGEHAEISQKLLAKVALARRILLKADQKAKYDQSLKIKLDAERDASAKSESDAPRKARPRRSSAAESTTVASSSTARRSASRRRTSFIVGFGAAGILAISGIVWIAQMDSGNDEPQTAYSTGSAESSTDDDVGAAPVPVAEPEYTVKQRDVPVDVTSGLFEVTLKRGNSKQARKRLSEMPEDLPLACIELVFGEGEDSGRLCYFIDQSMLVTSFRRESSEGSPELSSDKVQMEDQHISPTRVADTIAVAMHDRGLQLYVDGRVVAEPLWRTPDDPSLIPDRIILWSTHFDGQQVVAVSDRLSELEDTDIFTRRFDEEQLSGDRISFVLDCNVNWELMQLLYEEHQRSHVSLEFKAAGIAFEIHHDGRVLRRTMADDATDSDTEPIGQIDVTQDSHSLRIDAHDYAVRLNEEDTPIGDWCYVDTESGLLPTTLEWDVPAMFESSVADIEFWHATDGPALAFDMSWTPPVRLDEGQRLNFRIEDVSWTEHTALKRESGVMKLRLTSNTQSTPSLELIIGSNGDIVLRDVDKAQSQVLGQLPDGLAEYNFLLDAHSELMRLFCNDQPVGSPVLSAPGESFREFDASFGVPVLNSSQYLANVSSPTVGTADAYPKTGEPLPALKARSGENEVEMVFRWCDPGQFVIADGTDRAQRVLITKGFYLGWYEVTRSQWAKLTGDEPWLRDPALAKFNKPSYPAALIHWHEANEFCTKLTAIEREAGRLPSGWRYSLPTEAQWEFACRAGSQAAFSFGGDEEDLPDHAWFKSNAKTNQFVAAPHRTGEKRPNAWGFYDMHGNVAEWCLDSFSHDLIAGTDPFCEIPDEILKTHRGGNWKSTADSCRSFDREAAKAAFRSNGIGFRVAIVQEDAEEQTDGD